jgi:uncharacterized membrane protein
MTTEVFITGLLTSSTLGGCIFLLGGKIMQWYPPRWPNYFYGYRTMSSLKTKETFDTANRYSAALMVKYGTTLIVFGLLTALFFSELYWWAFLSAGMVAMLACVVALIVKTEKYLSAHFDKNGKQKIF